MTMTQPGSRNLAQLAEDWLSRLGDHESLIFEGITYRAAEQLGRSRSVAAALTGLGVGPGDRVVVLMANCPEVTVSYLAIWRAGAVVTPVVFLVSRPELEHILADSGATAVITTPELAPVVTAAAGGAPDLRYVIVAGAPAAGTGGDTVTGLLAGLPGHVRGLDFAGMEQHPAASIVARGNDDLAALMYTGGTTGRAKGVMLTHRNLHECAASLQRAAAAPGLTRALLPLPMSHAYGMIVTLANFHADEPGLTILQRWFEPAAFLSLAQQHRVQRTALVPAMIQMLLAQPLEDYDLSELRVVGSGAAPLAAMSLRQWEERVPGSEICEGYGCTESGAVISANPPGARRAGSVGLPIPGYEVSIRDDDDHDLPAGADGEVCVRAAGVMRGYWHADAETGRVLAGGWLHTGDIGRLDDDGYLYIVDRKKDLILRGGFNVYPRDVEDVLMAHPGVAMAGVVGKADARLGEEVVAFVAPRPGAALDPGELTSFAREHLAAHKYPRDIHVVAALPLTSVGKLDRKALRAQAAGQPANA